MGRQTQPISAPGKQPQPRASSASQQKPRPCRKARSRRTNANAQAPSGRLPLRPGTNLRYRRWRRSALLSSPSGPQCSRVQQRARSTQMTPAQALNGRALRCIADWARPASPSSCFAVACRPRRVRSYAAHNFPCAQDIPSDPSRLRCLHILIPKRSGDAQLTRPKQQCH